MGELRGEAQPETGASADADVHAFLIGDIRGWTAFTQEHGDEVAARLAARFAEVTRRVIEGHHGRVVELRGDEVMAVFGSPRSAIRAAVAALQQCFVEESTADPTLPLTVGIGLDAGEAVAVEGGYRGGALNVADLGTQANSVSAGTISGPLGQVQVTDARSAAAGSGWIASVISTAFTPPAGPAIPASNVSYSA